MFTSTIVVVLISQVIVIALAYLKSFKMHKTK